MTKLRQLIAKLFWTIVDSFILSIFIIVEKNEPRINKVKTKRLITKLGYCHDSVVFYFPIYIEPKEKVFIQEGVSIAPFVQIWAHAGVKIGRNSMIGSHTVISTATHDHSISQMNTKRIDKPVTIGDNVWIASGVIITPGVTIGDGAVIGAGSVVLSDVEDNAIVVGNPGRFLKYREIHDQNK
jgi:maltose O-acetyltransferase